MASGIRSVIGLVLAAHGVACASTRLPSSPLGAGHYEAELEHDGWTRDFVLHVSPSDAARSAEKRPLVVVLHGGGSSAAAMEEVTGFSRIAEREGFIVVYPNALPMSPHGGFGRLWNDGRCCGRAYVFEADDASFVVALIDDVAARVPVDRSRVYLVGYSNGGALAYHTVLRYPERFAGLAVYAATVEATGPLDAPRFEPPPSSELPSMISVHSLMDPRVAYRGGQLMDGRVDVPVPAFARYWAALVGCRAEAERESEHGGAVRAHHYRDCPEPRRVSHLALVGWDHEWPGRANYDALTSDEPLKGFEAAEAMWSFFREAGPSGDQSREN